MKILFKKIILVLNKVNIIVFLLWSIAELINLESLNLSNKQLEELPSSISTFTWIFYTLISKRLLIKYRTQKLRIKLYAYEQ